MTEEKKKIVFVVNPISGTQGKKAILKCVEERIDRSIYDYKIVETLYAGHATHIAADAVKDPILNLMNINNIIVLTSCHSKSHCVSNRP